MPAPPNMKPQTFFTPFVLHLLLPSLFGVYSEAHVVNFYISNNCPFPIWPATAPNRGEALIGDGGFFLPSGMARTVQAPWRTNGRIWARTGCDCSPNSTRPCRCDTGDCGRLACGGRTGTPPATLVQFSLQGGTGNPHSFSVSVVDGYNLPVSVWGKTANCYLGGCSKDLKKTCPEELELRGKNGEVVGCKSACLAFNLDVFCCRNRYGSPETCRGSNYSKMFKDACPNYYSYAFDSTAPVLRCAAEEFAITFCPNRWGRGWAETSPAIISL